MDSGGTKDVTNYQYASVASGTAGTPTATKGTVSNHSVSVTPSVTNTAGFITGGISTGSAVTVSASELVSGAKSITSNGSGQDVANYATVNVSVPNSYSASDEGKVVSDGELIAQGDATYSSNGTYDTTEISEVTVAIPAGSAGTPTATKGTVSNHAVSVTPSVTNTAGVITGGTKTGTAVTVSASELVSGTYTVDSSGTKDVTNYQYANIPSGGFEMQATKGTVSNHSVSVTGNLHMTSGGFIAAGDYPSLPTTVSASELVSGAKSITSNGNNQDVTNYATVNVSVPNSYSAGDEGKVVSSGALVSQNSASYTENGTYDTTLIDSVTIAVEGGGSSVLTETINFSSASAYSLTYTGLKGEPIMFTAMADATIPSTSTPILAAFSYDGTTVHAQTIRNTTNAQVSYDDSSLSYTYNNGTLTITTSSILVEDCDYFLTYAYGGPASCVGTKDVQVGSGATSISFTGLEEEPIAWSCIFKSNFGTSSGYQRVIYVESEEHEGSKYISGMAMDTSAKSSSQYWT